MTIPQQKNSCPGGKVCSGHTVDGGDSDRQGLRGKGRVWIGQEEEEGQNPSETGGCIS